jgi:hypothetical protein
MDNFLLKIIIIKVFSIKDSKMAKDIKKQSVMNIKDSFSKVKDMVKEHYIF